MFNNLIVSAKLEAYIRSLIVNTQGDPVREDEFTDYEQVLEDWLQEQEEIDAADPDFFDHPWIEPDGDSQDEQR